VSRCAFYRRIVSTARVGVGVIVLSPDCFDGEVGNK
jgi:hypothetical protein